MFASAFFKSTAISGIAHCSQLTAAYNISLGIQFINVFVFKFMYKAQREEMSFFFPFASCRRQIISFEKKNEKQLVDKCSDTCHIIKHRTLNTGRKILIIK